LSVKAYETAFDVAICTTVPGTALTPVGPL
jgi:hypothetical protein